MRIIRRVVDPPGGPVRERFESYIRGVMHLQRVLILCHDYPDPDALASACALRTLLSEGYGLECAITYGGIIGRAENKTMERVLGINAHPIEVVDPSQYPLVALVDTQPATGNNSLPDSRLPDMVFDHHPPVPRTAQVPYADVRDNYGTTCTLIHEYLVQAGVPVGRDLATAITYAIRAETQDLGREFEQADKDAYYSLIARADNLKLHEIVNARVPPAYFHGLIYAIENATLYKGGYLFSDVGRMEFPELAAEMADIFMRLQSSEWVLCMGSFKNAVYLSMRTRSSYVKAGDVMKELVRDLGSGGGHAAIAGGRIPLKAPSEYDPIRRTVVSRLQDVFGLSAPQGTDLLSVVE
jgi:nanoRNase/pAp phosphatase (c-di-AMP/oligoRNAs hydrolase)